MSDLLLQLFERWIQKKDPPDILSIEYPEGSTVIRLKWFSGEIRDYGYTKDRWDIVWNRFNQYWQGEACLPVYR